MDLKRQQDTRTTKVARIKMLQGPKRPGSSHRLPVKSLERSPGCFLFRSLFAGSGALTFPFTVDYGIVSLVMGHIQALRTEGSGHPSNVVHRSHRVNIVLQFDAPAHCSIV